MESPSLGDPLCMTNEGGRASVLSHQAHLEVLVSTICTVHAGISLQEEKIISENVFWKFSKSTLKIAPTGPKAEAATASSHPLTNQEDFFSHPQNCLVWKANKEMTDFYKSAFTKICLLLQVFHLMWRQWLPWKGPLQLDQISCFPDTFHSRSELHNRKLEGSCLLWSPPVKESHCVASNTHDQDMHHGE